MPTVKKIAVFDLDGTLWSVNSHYELINLYYRTKFFTSFFYRCLYKVVPPCGKQIRDYFFDRIPDAFIDTIDFEFNRKIVNLLHQKKIAGYEPVIVSNAPREIIVSKAAKRLGCSYLCAEVGEKLRVLKGLYDWTELFVCTDNPTDSDLLSVAKAYFLVIPNRRVEKKFKELGFANE